MKTILYFQSSCCENNDALLRGVCRKAHRVRWDVQIIPYAKAAASRQLDERGDGAKPPIRDLVAFWKPRGAIVECGSAVGLLAAADFAPLPVVFLDCSSDVGAPAVRSDNRDIGEHAARELLALGFADYAYAPWFEPLAWSRARGDAFAACIRRSGCAFHRLDWGGDASEIALRKRFAEWIRGLPRPVAVFAANDYIAARVISGARAEGLHVPDDVAVLGVDNDLRICNYTQPTISTLAPDYEGAGQMAAELLDRRLRQPSAKIGDALFGIDRIVRRDSTRLMRRRDARIDKILEIVQNEAHAGLRPSEIARRLKCSRRLLEIRFREATGRTLLAEIRAARIERARQLLSRDDLLLSDVAQQCGYRSECAFRRAYEKVIGRSPRNRAGATARSPSSSRSGGRCADA